MASTTPPGPDASAGASTGDGGPPASAPPASAPPASATAPVTHEFDTHARDALDETLAALVREGTLSPAQAGAVANRFAERSLEAEGAPPTDRAPAVATAEVPAEPAAPAPQPPAWRGRLLEAAVYVGVAFVLAAMVLLVGQEWDALSRPARIALVGGLTLTGLTAGVLLGRPIMPTPGEPLEPAHAVRRRSASTILTATAGLAAGTVAIVVGDTPNAGVLAAAAALVVMVIAQVLAPSVLSEIALFATAVAFAATLLDRFLETPSGETWQTQDWESRNRILFGSLLGLGTVWAWGVSRALRQRLLAISLGLALCLQAALALSGESTAPAVIAMAVIAVATVVTYLRDPAWPWVTAAVIAATASVFLVAGEALGPAVAFLIAGLALLGSVGVLALLRRRGRERATREPSP